MQSRKEYLFSKGLIPQIGRGRISGKNMAVIEREYENGMRFSDWEPDGKPKEIKNRAPKAIKPKAESKPTPAPVVISDPQIPFPENDYVAYERRDGKRHYRSMRSACNNCRVSLVACRCFASGIPARIVREDGSGSVEVFLDKK